MSEARWLVRTKAHEILGPYSEAEIRAQIADGVRLPTDEICASAKYWFYLSEADELKRYLNLVLPIPKRERDPDDEETDTQTATHTDTPTQPTGAKASAAPAPAASTGGAPSASFAAASASAAHPISNATPNAAPSGFYAASEKEPAIEGSTLVRYVFYFLLGILAFALYRIFQSAQS